MKFKVMTLALTGLLAAGTALGETRIEQNLPPTIKHFPPGVAYIGQPIPIYAEVTDETGKVKKVSLYYALSQQNVPIEVPMKRVRGNRYSGVIPGSFFTSGVSKIWYFVEARDSFDDKAETSWMPVLIKDPTRQRTQPEEQAAEGSEAASGSANSAGATGSAFPAGATGTAAVTGGGIGAGTVLGTVVVVGGVGAGAAAAAGAFDSDDGDGGGGFDASNVVSVNASGSASGGFSSGNQDKVIDGASAVGGRRVTGVRVTLNYQAYSIRDQFQILYNGNVIADTGLTSGSGTIQGVAGGSSTQVIIRVKTPSGGTAWNWNAKVEFSAR